MVKPLIVTAELDAEDQRWFDGLRQRYFPPERNRLNAHLTMFHALPPSAEGELRALLGSLAARPKLKATLSGPYSLGRGVAFRIRSPELEELRQDIAEHFHGSLTAQDSQGWRPHITIQNKVEPSTARATLAEVSDGFEPRSMPITGLGLHRYDGGPWEFVRRYPFRN